MVGGAAWESLRSTVRRPFESLPSRIIVSVFAAALVTSGLVTWISTESTETFLRSKIDERFPAVLQQARLRVEAWYEQRQLEIETFARSETVVASLALGGDPESRDETRKYLEYVREGVPHYRALFTLGVSGTPHVWVGDEVGLARSLQDRLAAVAAPRVGTLQRAEGADQGAFQIISAPVLAGQERLGSLHAIVPSAGFRSRARGPSWRTTSTPTAVTWWGRASPSRNSAGPSWWRCPTSRRSRR
jgi:hypothetical protein